MVKLKVIKNSTFKDNRGFYWNYMEKEYLKILNLIMINFQYQKKSSERTSL